MRIPPDERETIDDLIGVQRDLSDVIAGLDDPHGFAIKDELKAYYKTEIHHGRLDPNLDTLVDKGLVETGNSTGERTATP